MPIGKESPLVMIVCTANICRSPMAAALLRHHLNQAGERSKGIRVESAGTWGVNDAPAASNARHVMKNRGLSLEEHRSRHLTRKMVYQADLILTMEASQKEALQVEFPAAAAKVMMLSELCLKHEDLEDPVERGELAFERCAEQLDEWIHCGLDRLFELLGRGANPKRSLAYFLNVDLED